MSHMYIHALNTQISHASTSEKPHHVAAHDYITGHWSDLASISVNNLQQIQHTKHWTSDREREQIDPIHYV
jgi:hypothetical protein